MDSEIEQMNHPNGIWYEIGGKRYWYIPYLELLSRHPKYPKNKKAWEVAYGGGNVDVLSLPKTAQILFYGVNASTGSLPLEFLDECRQAGVNIIVHRNHIAQPMVFAVSASEDRDDLLTKQILAREDAKSKAYIARTLIKAQWESREWLAPSPIPYSDLARTRTSREVMAKEAEGAREYWHVYYRKLGLASARRSKNPVSEALDAISRFQSGIILRWTLVHGLSPSHGFLHTSTSYPALVYDLLEPVRWIGEKAVFDEALVAIDKTLVYRSTKRFKAMLDEPIQAEPTRQKVYRKTLMVGQVIALRYYLKHRRNKKNDQENDDETEDKMRRFLPPIEKPAAKAGRKRKVPYTLPGQIWSA